MADRGLDVTVLTTDPGGQLPQSETREGVKIRRVPAYPKNRDYFFAPGLDNLIRSGGWDILHFQGSHTLVAPLGMVSALRAGIPYLVTFHTGGHSLKWRNQVRSLQWKVISPLLKRSCKLIAVSRFEARYFQEVLGLPVDRFAVIPNGSQMPQTLLSQSETPKTPTIVSIGRLERYKGHHRVLAAMPFLRQQVPDVQLRIIGSGPEKERLLQQASDLNVADCVRIGSIPSQDRQEMASAIAQASLVTLLSDYEAHPISVTESLALGRPVLVAETSGLCDFVEDGLAHGIPVDSSPKQVANAIYDLLVHPPHATGQLLPTWESCTDQLMALYHQIAQGEACAS
jgi:glycosyltransferase involved in cell wall biosynthesis